MTSPDHLHDPLDSVDDIHDRVRRGLAADEQRYTSGRRRLVALLAAAGRPVTLPELLEMDRSLPQSSVYRNLDVLERSGLVHRLALGAEHARFELAEQLLGHHHHLICVDCGKVDDIRLDAEVERLVVQRLAQAAAEVAFTPVSHSLDLHGRCADCEPAL